MAYSIEKDTYLGIPKCYKAQTQENMDAAGILQILNDRTLSLSGQGVSILLFEEPGMRMEQMKAILEQSAPRAEVIEASLHDASEELKDFYFIPHNQYAVSEEEILEILQDYEKFEKPLVVCFPFGANNGSHTGDSLLASRLNQLALQKQKAVVVSMGNEGANMHHFKGFASAMEGPQKVEILVQEDMKGFYFELWSLPPDRIQIEIQSPTGERTKRGSGLTFENISYEFLFEKTKVVMDYRDVGMSNRAQLIFARFENVVAGIWTILVYPNLVEEAHYHIWLPMKGFLEQDVRFLEPDVQNTLTMPADARSVISVGGYLGENGSVFLENGRGYTLENVIKPDFLAPCKEGGLLGTSVATAFVAGACALTLEWALSRADAQGINTIDIKNFLIRGCDRQENQIYPNPLEGYGKMNLFNSFLLLK